MAPALEPENDIRQAVSGLMELAGLPKDKDPTAQNIQEAVDKLKLMVDSLHQASMASAEAGGKPQSCNKKSSSKNVLIAGQLGIILHQLRQTLGKLGGEITLAKDLDAALDMHQQQDYGLVIIDLFMPTEREGMFILDEVRRVATATNQDNTQIIILAPNSRDQNLREACLNKGATFFLEKIDGWHKTILGIYQGEITAENFNI